MDHPPPALLLWVGWRRIVVMAMVEDFANTATCALRYLACTLSSTDADVLSGNCCTLADVAGGIDRVKGDEIAGTFADSLGCGSSSLCGALADVAGSAANVTTGVVGLGPGLVRG